MTMKRIGIFLLSFLLLSCGKGPGATLSEEAPSSEDTSTASEEPKSYFEAFDPETDFYRVKLNYSLQTPQKETVRSGTFTKQFYHGVDESGHDILIEQTTLYSLSSASTDENDDKIETRSTTYKTPTKTYTFQESGSYAIKSAENDLSRYRVGFPLTLVDLASEEQKGFDTIAKGSVKKENGNSFLSPCFNPVALESDIAVNATFKSDSKVLTELSLSYQDGIYQASLRYQYSIVNALLELPA